MELSIAKYMVTSTEAVATKTQQWSTQLHGQFIIFVHHLYPVY